MLTIIKQNVDHKKLEAEKIVFFFFSSSSILIISTQNLFNDKEFELFVSQKFATLLFMTSFSLKNFFSFSWTNSHFSEFRKADDETNKIEKFNLETEKIKADKFSIDELMKTQAEEQKIMTIFFFNFNFFLSHW
jgi:hypothetical protein